MPQETRQDQYNKGYIEGNTDTYPAWQGATDRQRREQELADSRELHQRFMAQVGSSSGAGTSSSGAGSSWNGSVLAVLASFGAGVYLAVGGHLPWTGHVVWGGLSGILVLIVVGWLIKVVPGLGLTLGFIAAGAATGWLAPELIYKSLTVAPWKERLATGAVAGMLALLGYFVVRRVWTFLVRILAPLLGPVFRVLMKVVQGIAGLALLVAIGYVVITVIR
jgi:hypothetical protein